MAIGTRVRLHGRGKTMLVVDIDLFPRRLLCAWPGGEDWFSPSCLKVVG